MKFDHDYMEFICWVDRCMFPVDLADDLKDLGLDKIKATFYEIEWKMMNQVDNKFTITRLYQNYCVGNHTKTPEGSLGFYLKIWLENRYEEWQGYKK